MKVSERQLEDELIDKLADMKYVFRGDIYDRATLERNFREKFQALNRVKLEEGEFQRLLEEIVTPDVFTASQTLRNRNAFTRDDGTPLNYTLVNINDWCKNDFEVVRQLRINTDYSHHRYDVLLLINGIPVVQIELKTLGINPRRAIEQIVEYKNDPGNGYRTCHAGSILKRTPGPVHVRSGGSVIMTGHFYGQRAISSMIPPAGLQALIDDGVIDEVLRPLKSGKEASVYVVRAGNEVRCAKVYKDMAQRSFQQRAQYQEGRKVRGSRQARAMVKASKFGRKEAEAAWKNAEVDALYQLAGAGVRVPQPYGYFGGVLVMEMVADAGGSPAPQLGKVELSAQTAREYHRFLVRQIARMLCEGLIHGDLSEYNVLVAPDGPVIIDLPQVVSAAGNNAARTMLRRDVGNITITLSRFAPELLDTHYAEEMWALFERGKLRPDSELTGHFVFDEREVDVDSVMQSINDAREEAIIRQRGRELAEAEA